MSDSELNLSETVRHLLQTAWARAVLSVAAGGFSAFVLYYALYRVELPSKPFIYVAF